MNPEIKRIWMNNYYVSKQGYKKRLYAIRDHK